LLCCIHNLCNRELIVSANETYKLEILDGIPTEQLITVYKMGARGSSSKETPEVATAPAPAVWWDLCAGPHLESTGQLDSQAIELLSVAGAYWRGNESNQMLQVRYYRITSILFLYKISDLSCRHCHLLVLTFVLLCCVAQSVYTEQLGKLLSNFARSS
jgi:hypothetical protein